jgi:AraC-like DNA-binding protein
MLYFTLLRIFFLVFGAVFIGFAVLFLLSRAKRSDVVVLCAAFMAIFGSYFVLLAFWEILAQKRMLTHVLSLVLGLSLVPTGLAITVKLLGDSDRPKHWLGPCILGTLLVCAVCSVMFLRGTSKSWPLTLCYSYVFGCYAVSFIAGLHGLRPLASLPRQLAVFLTLLGLCILMLGAIMILQALDLDAAQYCVWTVIIVLFCFMAGTIYRYPEIFLVLEAQSRAAHYSRSLLSRIDVPSKLEGIERLMREQHLYRDSELCLEELADRIHLSPHQLSELLNVYAKQNFSEYIMRYRIEQAKRELVDPRRDTILDIAFSCGFSAKSTFNAAFRKATGLTPSAYREVERSRDRENA